MVWCLEAVVPDWQGQAPISPTSSAPSPWSACTRHLEVTNQSPSAFLRGCSASVLQLTLPAALLAAALHGSVWGGAPPPPVAAAEAAAYAGAAIAGASEVSGWLGGWLAEWMNGRLGGC